MTDTETLINTLLANGLAASRTEAQRMAESMISTSNKVNESMRDQKDNSMVKDYGEARRAKQALEGTPQEQKIQELRQNALNPQPVNVQTEFDTPANDARKSQEMDFTAEVSNEAPASPEVSVQAAQPVEQPIQAVPTMTPEEYAARQMQGMGAQTTSDLLNQPSTYDDMQIPQDPVSSAPEQPNFAQEEPMQEEMQQAPVQESAPMDFISQEPASQPMTDFNAEPEFLQPEMTQEPMMPAMQAPEPVPQPPVQQVPEQPMSSGLESMPPQEAPAQPMQQQFEQPVAQAPVAQEPVEPEKKKSTMTEQEKKLAEEVDLSRVFNFSNK